MTWFKRKDKEATASPPLVCSFCAKEQAEVRRLIAGPNVFICNECIELCIQIVAEEDENWRERIIKMLQTWSFLPSNPIKNLNEDTTGTP